MGEVVVTTLGVIATVLSALSLLPQVIRTCRTRAAGDISGTWLAVVPCSRWRCGSPMEASPVRMPFSGPTS
jgi:uncharacterized protein with PQ loop repeat